MTKIKNLGPPATFDPHRRTPPGGPSSSDIETIRTSFPRTEQILSSAEYSTLFGTFRNSYTSWPLGIT
ncbi:hypothetical protein CC2G_012516 [Coprinopsis cinerea AmutBmut pab1-1]|nr:hypothetical protein CC2G_012516 [Coprinopsis cinerea AmutBmut pab1-1]